MPPRGSAPRQESPEGQDAKTGKPEVGRRRNPITQKEEASSPKRKGGCSEHRRPRRPPPPDAGDSNGYHSRNRSGARHRLVNAPMGAMGSNAERREDTYRETMLDGASERDALRAVVDLIIAETECMDGETQRNLSTWRISSHRWSRVKAARWHVSAAARMTHLSTGLRPNESAFVAICLLAFAVISLAAHHTIGCRQAGRSRAVYDPSR